MIELSGDNLVFSFPSVHPQARLTIGLQRTLRIPDDDPVYPLPPGLGLFPLRHVDDYADTVPARWLEHGGVLCPMYQSEAMWLHFAPDLVEERGNAYAFAIKVATGKIDAVTGRAWSPGLHRGPQDYLVAPNQPWLDGYCVEKGTIRQFVAMPLGAGYTAEEQVTGEAEHGGLQIAVYPMKREAFERRFPVLPPEAHYRSRGLRLECSFALADAGEMGLAPGGKMTQEIYEDPFDPADWDLSHTSRCFVHIANSLVWQAITGERPPFPPPTAKEYTDAGLPWFDYYDDQSKAVDGSAILQKLKSVFALGRQKRDVPLPENAPVKPGNVVPLGPKLKKGQVREYTL
jgi:hypothetical protein